MMHIISTAPALLVTWLLLLQAAVYGSNQQRGSSLFSPQQQRQTLCSAFEELGHRVNVAIQAQVGDLARLEEQSLVCERFRETVLEVRAYTIPEELLISGVSV